MVYLIHFSEKLHHAQHYLGFVEKKNGLDSRLEYHRNGRGSKLLKAVALKGIEFSVVRTWEDGDRNFERSLKNKRNAPKLCPVCQEIKMQQKLLIKKDLVSLHSDNNMKNTGDVMVVGKDIEAEERNATVAKMD